MKKIINVIKKNIFGVIIGGIIFGSVGVFAASKFYAKDVLVNAPKGSNLGSDATLQGTLDELYSIADKYDELNKKIDSLKEIKDITNNIKINPVSGNEKITATVRYAYMSGNEVILSVLFINSSGSDIAADRGIYFTIESSDGSVFSGNGTSVTAAAFGTYNTYNAPRHYIVDQNQLAMVTSSTLGKGNGLGAIFTLMKIN